MNNIIFKRTGFGYSAKALLEVGGSHIRIPFICDTGASRTVVSSRFFRNDGNSVGSQLYHAMISFKMVHIGNNASGDGIYGYPCHVDCLRINKTEIKNFYFFISDKVQDALLGFDFIDACRMEKLSAGNISMIFNKENYNPEWLSDIKNIYRLGEISLDQTNSKIGKVKAQEMNAF